MSPQIVTDDRGKKIGVFLTYKDYEKIIRELEDAADERAFDRAMRRKEETIPAREAFKQIEERRKKAMRQNEETIPLREAIKLRKEKLKHKNDKV
jgi:hypothetical protein